MSQKKLLGLMEEYRHSGVKFDERFAGFNWGAAKPFENRWEHELPLA